MKTSSMFPSKYTRKDDVHVPVVVIIEDVRIETVGEGVNQEEKPIIFFRRDQLKPLVLNSGNKDIIEATYGEESDDWRGKSIELYEDPGVTYAGKRVGGIRVRIPSSTAKTATTPVDDSIWSFAKALAECEAVGITRVALVAKFKELDKTGYIASRDTIAVKEMIAQVQNGDAASEDLASIPF